MQTVNIKNIAISICLGVFSFHMYVVKQSTIIYSKDFGLFDPGTRNIAAEDDLDCVHADITNTLSDPAYKPETCEFQVLLESDESTQEVRARFIFKQGDSRVDHPPINSEPTLLTLEDFPSFTVVDGHGEFSNEQNSILQSAVTELFHEIRPEAEEELSLRLAAQSPTDEHINRNQVASLDGEEGEEAEETSSASVDSDEGSSSNEDAASSTPPPAVADGGNAVDGGSDSSTTGDQNTDSPATVVAVTADGAQTIAINNDPDQDEEHSEFSDVKEVLSTLTRLLQKADSCVYTSSTLEEIEDVKASIESILNENDVLNVSDDSLRNLSEEDRTALFSKESLIEELLDENDDVDFQDKITCLSDKALEESSTEEQIAYYAQYIKPEVMSAIDSGVENTEDLTTLLSSIGANSSFAALTAGNPLIDAVTTQTQAVSIEALNCKASFDANTCIAQLTEKANLAKTNLFTVKDDESVELSSKLVLAEQFESYNYWIESFGGTPVSLENTGSQTASENDTFNQIAENNAGSQDILSRQAQILKEAVNLNSQLSRQAPLGSNARTSGILNAPSYNAQGRQGVGAEGDVVDPSQYGGSLQ